MYYTHTKREKKDSLEEIIYTTPIFTMYLCAYYCIESIVLNECENTQKALERCTIQTGSIQNRIAENEI